MRTDERTYKQYLTSGDPDKSDSLHETAIAYLCQPEKIEKIRNIYAEDRDDGGWFFKISDPIVYTRHGYHSHQTTREIKGYADLSVYLCRKAYDDSTYVAKWIIIEVKSGRVSSGAIIQQLSTYRHYGANEFERPKLVVATLYKISKTEKMLFENQSIKHIYLDPELVRNWAANAVESVDQAF